jgi:3-oxoadipate enol-lactonase
MSFATVNGIGLNHAFQPGTGGTQPLVLLHEMGGALASWDLVVGHLPQRRILRLDLRGFGLSEKPTGPLALKDMAADVAALIVHLGLGPVHLVGSAVGAAVAISCAADHPETTAQLTCLAPATGIPADRRGEALTLAARLEAEGVRGFLEADTIPKAWPAALPRGAGFEIFCATQLATAPSSLAAAYRMLAQSDLRPALAALNCPLHLVAGQHDIARPPALIRALADSLPGARFTDIPSGHFMALQTPALVARLLT